MPGVSTANVFVEALKLLREGKVQEADDLLAKGIADASKAEPAAVIPPPPRDPAEIVTDLARAIVEHLGSPAPLKALLDELDAAHAADAPHHSPATAV
jgi:hypothetical protein